MPRWSVTWSRPSPSAEPPAAAEASGPERVRVRLTGAGALGIALVLTAGIVAVNSGNNVLYLVVSSLLALFALSGILGHLNLTAVSLLMVAPDELWAGRPASARALVANGRPRRAAFLIAVGAERGGPQPSTAVELPPGARRELDFAVTFPARGRQRWPRLEVSSEFPFGLIRRGRVLRPPGSVLVYPAPLPVAWESVERAEREGELVARRAPGLGGDYRGLRDYAPGDSIARVRWASWLRLRRLQTKEFESEGAPPVVYAFDAVPGPGTEERLGQLAWLVRAATRRGRSVGLELPGRAIPPGSGVAHRRELLAALALYGTRTP